VRRYPRIGVLALQGDFREHRLMLESVGAEVVEVRLPKHLRDVSGLIIPGGESTTIGKLAREYEIDEAVKEKREKEGLAIWGTCAGAIWIAQRIIGHQQPHLPLMDIAVRRNAFGRQVDSFEALLEIAGLNTPFKGVFIRAPEIVDVGSQVEVLSRYQGKIVFARQGNAWATSFHPELTDDARLHEMFISTAKN